MISSSNDTPDYNGPVTERGYTMQFDPLPEGGFSVFVPAIPEICTFGETLEEARAKWPKTRSGVTWKVKTKSKSKRGAKASMRREYDFSGGVVGKYANRYR